MRPSVLALACLAGCTPAALPLKQVVLYQNGIGFFARTGTLSGDRLRLSLRGHEVDDVLKTLTVVDRAGAGRDGTAASLRPPATRNGNVTLELALAAGGSHDLQVSYAVPTPAWKSSYRVVLGDGETALLQAWAIVDNASGEDWSNVELTLATGAPLSFAVDLKTPRFVARPDVTGKLVEPTATGAITSERALPGDSDGDGVPDADDLCPNDAEDKDGFEDQDGCPDPDNDKDRIADKDDKCPNEPETYNGFEDDDGCPDRGRVVVTHSHLEILDNIYFAKGDSTVKPASVPILEAVAATLQGNPSITSMEVQGHASDGEADGWGLSSARAASVRSWLVAHGVAAARLKTRAYGVTQPVATGRDDAAQARNRRVNFLILSRSDGKEDEPRAARPLDVATVERSVTAAATPARVAGSVRYQLRVPVSLPRGTSTMVSIVNDKIAGEEIFLYRPDAHAPGSELHPWRAARLKNGARLTLEPGPVALFARGTFVGEGLLERLHPDETALLPFALDASATVRAEADEASQPVRVVALAKGVCTVENARIHTTRYEVTVGSEAPRRIFLRHARQPNYEPTDLPPGTERSGEGALLVPVPITAGKTTTLTLHERRPETREIRLLDEGGPDLLLYVAASHLPPDQETRLRALARLRADLATAAAQIEDLRTRLDDATQRAGELRENLRTVDKNPRAESFKRDLLTRLTAATRTTETLSQQLAQHTEAHAELRARLSDSLRDLQIGGHAP